MDNKQKNILIAVLSAIILILLVIIGTGALKGDGDKSGTSSETSDIISADHFQESADVTTTEAEEKVTTSFTTTKKSRTTVTQTTTKKVTTSKTSKTKKTKTTAVTTTVTTTTTAAVQDDSYVEYHFRNKKLLNQHFEKHGGEFRDDFGYETAEEYEKGASDVINAPDALYKLEAEDGDGVYYIEDTNEFVILSTDGYIRTYFRPSGGIDYFNRQ